MRVYLFLTAALCLAGPALAQDHGDAAPTQPAAHGPGWAYSGPNGPENWASLDAAYAACASGQQESPIDLVGAVSADLGPLDLQWTPRPARVIDTGHAIQVEAAAGSRLNMGGKVYQLLQFHVHQPSEHLLNGRRFPLELHFVHAGEDGSLGVVGIFADTGDANPALQTALDAVGASGDAGAPELDMTAMLPGSRAYFRYEGSLTTPPCSETVDWAVLEQPITASAAQIEAFARLHPGNTRPLQPLNRRFLLRSAD
ncbi:MAG: carbonic anhydrase family protein [Alphaproteobacteria bacterium]|nr:carbonic anhydrase family protein [Alphaproteobacteria bacterium]MBU2270117.1 carbonic anhydrase family protein [Alphaproteobacteria bacterium]MBU2417460.1 carbonic anhydrase family protein [Alphaproteobacteria bacterium]